MFSRSSVFAAAIGAVAAFGVSVAQADRLDDMISPLTNPVNFEDPRANSELRPIYIHHVISDDFITKGGEVDIYALQIRYAIDDRLAIIANKDGYVQAHFDEVLSDESGLGDLAAGLKYAFYKDAAAGQILTAGLTYELPTGDEDIFQGQGDGALNPFLSAAFAVGPANVMQHFGLRIAMDSSDSSFLDYDLHVSTKFDWFYPLFELNVHHVMNAGDRLPIADEGEDYFNFGASESDGRTMVTMGFGARAKAADNLDFGLGLQLPVTTGAGSNLIEWRLTADAIYSF